MGSLCLCVWMQVRGGAKRICVYVRVMCDFMYAPCVMHVCVLCVSLRTCHPCVYMYVQCMCDCVCVCVCPMHVQLCVCIHM